MSERIEVEDEFSSLQTRQWASRSNLRSLPLPTVGSRTRDHRGDKTCSGVFLLSETAWVPCSAPT